MGLIVPVSVSPQYGRSWMKVTRSHLCVLCPDAVAEPRSAPAPAQQTTVPPLLTCHLGAGTVAHCPSGWVFSIETHPATSPCTLLPFPSRRRKFRSGLLVAVAELDLNVAFATLVSNVHTSTVFCTLLHSDWVLSTTGWQWVPTHSCHHVPHRLFPCCPFILRTAKTRGPVPSRDNVVALLHITSAVAISPCASFSLRMLQSFHLEYNQKGWS